MITGRPRTGPAVAHRVGAERANRRPRAVALFLALVLASGLPPPKARAQSPETLGVFPTRVVLEGRTRSAEVIVINRGGATATYRVSLRHMRMTEDGALVEVQDPLPGERFADDLLRYGPRRVRLDPGMSQVVRIVVRKPRDLAPGEYRSHLVFQPLPRAPEPAPKGQDAVGLSVRLTVVFAISIPVIARHGDLSASVTISDLALQREAEPEGGRELVFYLNRSGERSVYGDIRVTFTPDRGPDRGIEREVALPRKVAVYAPTPRRVVRIPLDWPEERNLREGRLRLSYRTLEKDGGELLAAAELPLP